MKKSLRMSAVVLCVVSLVAVAPTSMATPSRGHEATTMGPGNDPTGSGTAVLKTVWDKVKICFDVSVSLPGETSWSASVYETAPNGPVAQLFTGSTTAETIGCVSKASGGIHVGKRKLRKLIDHPNLFDVRVYSSPTYAGGAIVGTLHKGSTP